MSALASPHNAVNGNGDDHHHIRLACQACQRKKIKCDRTYPCGQCTRSNLQCAASSRKPRARHGGKRAVDSELRTRISKLESLVENLSGEVGLQDEQAELEPSPTAAREERTSSDDASSPTVGQYLGSPFWSSLTTEVQAIRDALEDDQEENEADSISPETVPVNGAPVDANGVDFFICPPGAIFVMPGALAEPPPQMQRILYDAFIENVDPMFKIFHTPSLARFLKHGEPYLGHELSAPCNRAVRAVSWFAAVNTLPDEECRQRFGQSQAELMQQYRRTVDVALAQADLLNTNDLATLQALVVYVGASRMSDVSRRVWTLTALVIRIARAMGLHLKAPGRTPFETELRRRLWHQIRFLDVFSAMDRATEALIAQGSFETPLPNNVNDSEFDENSTSIPHHETRITGMCFALIAYEAVRATQRLVTAENAPTGDTWQHRLDFAHDFSKQIHEQYLQYCDLSIPFQRLAYRIGRSMSQGMILRAVRPIQRHVSSVPPRIDSPYVLQLATEALMQNEKIYADPDFGPWRWLVWVQWHPLAVALAGLCSIRGTELADQAWLVVERNFERQWSNVADTRNGMLWRPIEKLYRKAIAFRDEGRRESLNITPQKAKPQQPPQQAPQQSKLTDFDALMRTPQPPPVSNGASPLSPITSTYATGAPHHQQPHMPTGSIPMDPIMTNSFDFDLEGIAEGMAPLPSGDMGWLDWESIMGDLNQPMDMDGMQSSTQVPGGQNWPSSLHQDMM